MLKTQPLAILATLIVARKFHEVVSFIPDSFGANQGLDPAEFISPQMLVSVFHYIANRDGIGRSTMIGISETLTSYPVMTVEYVDQLIKSMIGSIPDFHIMDELPSVEKMLPLILLHLHATDKLVRWGQVHTMIAEGLNLHTTSLDSWASLVLNADEKQSQAFIYKQFIKG